MDTPGVEFVSLGPGDYDRAKRVLNRARHPGFVGRELYYRCATTGAAVIAMVDGQDMGVALAAKGKLQALSVVVAGQGRGVGSALMAKTRPQFVSAIMDKVPWFERLGYRAVGAARPGQNGKMAVQLMELAGDVQANEHVRAAPAPPPTKRETVPLPEVPDVDIGSLVNELADLTADDDEGEKRRRAFDAGEPLHDGQRNLVARIAAAVAALVALCCGRRFGKSYFACWEACRVARKHAGVTVLLIAATQATVEGIYWDTLAKFRRDWALGGEMKKGARWSYTFGNGSRIVLLPVDSVEAADKCRGLGKVVLIVVDESQRYKREVLSYLVRDVLAPMLLDLRAKGVPTVTWMMGTPNPAGQTGAFWDFIHRPGVLALQGTIYDNTALGAREDIERAVDELLKENQETREGTWYRREILAQWVKDVAWQVYAVTEASLYDPAELPPLATLPQRYVATDVGTGDGDAYVVLAHSETDPTLWVIDMDEWRGQGDSVLGAKLEALHEEHKPLKMPIDSLGQGKRALVNIIEAHPQIPLEAREVLTVAAQVRSVNDRLRIGKLRIPRGSRLAEQIVTHTWVEGVVGGKIDEHGTHSNLIPALRYGVQAALPFLPPDPEPTPTGEAAVLAARRAEVRAEVERIERERRVPGWVRQAIERGQMSSEAAGEFLAPTDEAYSDDI